MAQAITAATDQYLLGHSDQELVRLELQASFLRELTEDVLRRAGLRPGMRVLDVGCGAGDVSLIAARMVGPGGSVLGIDRAAEPLALARRRAEAEGLRGVRFEQAEIGALASGEAFDAVVGRLVLVYARDPAKVLQSLLGHLKPGGIVAFQEMDIGRGDTVPSLPLFETCMDWIYDLYGRAGLVQNMGSQLYRTFRAVGLAPSLIGGCPVIGSAEGGGMSWLTQTVRSLLPMMVQLGVATAEEVDIGTLEERLRRGAREIGACMICPLMVGAWARVPAQ